MANSTPPRRYSFLHHHAYKILSVVLVLGFLNALYPFEKMLEQLSEYREQQAADWTTQQYLDIQAQRAAEFEQEAGNQAAFVKRLLECCEPSQRELIEKMKDFAETRQRRVLAKHDEATQGYHIESGKELRMSWEQGQEVTTPWEHFSYELRLLFGETPNELGTLPHPRQIRFEMGYGSCDSDLACESSSVEYLVELSRSTIVEKIRFSLNSGGGRIDPPFEVSLTPEQTLLNFTFQKNFDDQQKAVTANIVFPTVAAQPNLSDARTEPVYVVSPELLLEEALKIIEASFSEGKFFKKNYPDLSLPQFYFNQEDEHYIEELIASHEAHQLQSTIYKKLEQFQANSKVSNQRCFHFIPDLFQHIQQERQKLLQRPPSTE